VEVLADNGRFVLAADGDVLLFFRRRIVPTWAVFVAGLLTVLLGANAVVLTIAGTPLAGAVLLGLAAVCGFVLRTLAQKRRAARERPLDPHAALLVLDLVQRQVRTGDGQVLAGLDAARAEKTMQATSSSRALTIAWSGGRMVVYRGDPFARHGSIDAPAEVLKARGVPAAW
jgi:hypothetical protein